MQSSRALPGGGSLSHQPKRSPSDARELTTYVFSSSRNTPLCSHTNGKLSALRCITIAMSTQGLSEAFGYICWNSAGPPQTHLFGILLTATLVVPSPSLLSVIRSTQ